MVVLKLWRATLTQMGWKDRLIKCTPLWESRALSPLAKLQNVHDWDLIGISTLGDIMEGTALRSFQTLREEFQLHKNQFYRYLQLRHAISPLLRGLEDLPENNPLESKLLWGPLGRDGISKVYHSLIINSHDLVLDLKVRWESLVGALDEEDWRDTRSAPREIAISTSLCLIQLRVLYMA